MFLVGTWWGEGLEDDPLTMRNRSPVFKYNSNEAHESQWSMLTPSPETHKPIVERILEFTRRYEPFGICLTHARFKHAADINSLFDMGRDGFSDAMDKAGLTPARIRLELVNVIKTLEGLTLSKLATHAEGKTLIEFLDALSGSDLFSRWFDFRCDWIEESVDGIFAQIRSARGNLFLGANAIGPLFSRLSGQNYSRLAGTCGFIQPLFGYMRWHVLQPIYMWAKFFARQCPSIQSAEALCLSAKLFGYTVDELSMNWKDRNQSDEGDEAAIIRMVKKQLSALPVDSGHYMPVLRGHGLGVETTRTLAELVREKAGGSVIYQGSNFIGGEAPHPGWK